MARLIFVPQYPTKMRYQEWWFKEFPNKLGPYFDSVITLGYEPSQYLKAAAMDFSPMETAVEYELHQIKQYLNLELLPDDILLLADLSFPGLFSNVLYHKYPKKQYAICHATSKNAYDYFSPNRRSKWRVETGHAKLFNKVVVASNYHKEKLGWDNVEVLPFPYPPFKVWRGNKVRDIISVARPGRQKINRKLEKSVRKFSTDIHRKEHNSWQDYYSYIAQSKVMLITSNEETYGYQVVDAVLNRCIPLAPNKYSYPELLPGNCLYNDLGELFTLINLYCQGYFKTPKLLIEEKAKQFYQNLARLMNE